MKNTAKIITNGFERGSKFFKEYYITGKPYKVAYYILGGAFRVPVFNLTDGSNSSAGFRTKEEAENFYNNPPEITHNIY